jgi:hypothetical protein
MPYRTSLLVACLALTLPALTQSVSAETDVSPFSIMRPEPVYPEPWLPPKYRSPHGTPQHIKPSRRVSPPHTGRAKVPPPIIVPETGRALPNLPTVSPSGPNGTETYQDRALRCAHQAGVYGQAAGNRNAYIGTCIGQ